MANIVTEANMCGTNVPIGVKSSDYVITEVDNADGVKATLTEVIHEIPTVEATLIDGENNIYRLDFKSKFGQ